jgi:hypothetical protein
MIEPWGEERQDLRNAMLCTQIAIYMEKDFDPKKDPWRFLVVKPDKVEKTLDEQVELVQLTSAALGLGKGI